MNRPECPNTTKKCGGCPLLALPYNEQLAQKQARLQALLGRFAPVEPVRGMADPWHYRNKAIATFAMQQGRLVCGLYAEGTHRVLPSADCLLQQQALNRTLQAVLEAARACRWTAYDEDRCAGMLRHVVLRGTREGRVLVTLVTPGPALPGSRNFCAALRRSAPWVQSVVQNINPTATSAVLGNREKVLCGPGMVVDTLCGLRFAISSRSFYQVNPAQTEVLYAAAMELAGLTGRETVVDAYCGIGTIGLCAAPRAGKVIGVERNPAAVRGRGRQRPPQRAAAGALLLRRRHRMDAPGRRAGAAPRRGLSGPAPGRQHPGLHRGGGPHGSRPGGVCELRPRNAGPGRGAVRPAGLPGEAVRPRGPLPPHKPY